MDRSLLFVTARPWSPWPCSLPPTGGQCSHHCPPFFLEFYSAHSVSMEIRLMYTGKLIQVLLETAERVRECAQPRDAKHGDAGKRWRGELRYRDEFRR